MANKPKKIVIVYSGAKHGGGIETYLDLFFANADKTKIDLTLISLGDWPLTAKLQATNCQLQVFSEGRINPLNVFRITKYLKNNDFELVVSQGTVANAYARAASLLSGVPSLVIIHSDSYYDYPNGFVRSIYAVIEYLTRFPTKHYIAVSQYLGAKLYQSGVSEDNISVIYNGVLSDQKPKKQKVESPKAKLVIGSIGRLHEVKNFRELILGCAALKMKSWKLKVIGEGAERSNLDQLIQSLGLEDKVELLGRVEDVGEQLSQIDIYVQPSLSEGFGLTVIEAMLTGKPVIVSPYGALPELVEHKETGIVMDGASHSYITEAIESLSSNKTLMKKVATNGKKSALERFGIERWSKETEKVLLEASK